ncbi:hypothetical protein B0F90DRAFT_1745975 [Multifurca ochricompacta]|uniref:Phosphoribulokinase/uridine kinase domain-containing protein n=1 Tax=Multifurca ochricompacta TaxID=376703 RepID=A0AAD4QK70_9AGAM|nr:hypothetical protein B0F90DRAFT_1745975 [Multifurca ochricompacta]
MFLTEAICFRTTQKMMFTGLSTSNHTSEQVQRSQRTRVILVGIGGATCTGKTTLAKNLRDILPGSFVIHQDPEVTLPIHPTLGQDWDTAPSAITWPRLRAFLRTQKPVPLTDSVAERWIAEITRVQKEVGLRPGARCEVVDTFDAKVFLRVPYDVLRERRDDRPGYATAEGKFLRDPPGYFEQLAYPAYLDAHRSIFTDGDVERGSPLLPDLVLIESLELSMNDIVARCCKELVAVLRKPVATVTREAQH